MLDSHLHNASPVVQLQHRQVLWTRVGRASCSCQFANEVHTSLYRIPGRLDDRGRLAGRGEESVAVACQQGVHMGEQGLHLPIAAPCPVVHCHLPPCYLIQHCLQENQYADIAHKRAECRSLLLAQWFEEKSGGNTFSL